jgi:hypothetical protein
LTIASKISKIAHEAECIVPMESVPNAVVVDTLTLKTSYLQLDGFTTEISYSVYIHLEERRLVQMYVA